MHLITGTTSQFDYRARDFLFRLLCDPEMLLSDAHKFDYVKARRAFPRGSLFCVIYKEAVCFVLCASYTGCLKKFAMIRGAHTKPLFWIHILDLQGVGKTFIY